MKTCNTCGEDLDLEAFPFRNKKKGTRHNQCKACMREASHRHYHEAAENQGKPCCICGERPRTTGRSRCRECAHVDGEEFWAARARQRAQELPEKKREWARGATLRKYGVTPEQYEAALVDQGGACLLCGEGDDLCIDHCHGTGRFRGLLCRTCNLGLGYFRDDMRLLLRAARYLEERS